MGHRLYLAETQEVGKLLRASEQEDERRNSGLAVTAKGSPTLPIQGLPPEEWLLLCVLSLSGRTQCCRWVGVEQSWMCIMEGGIVGLHDLGWDSIFQEWQRARGANQWKEGPKEGPPWRPDPAQAPALLCTVLLNQ